MGFEITGISELLGDLNSMAAALSQDGSTTKRALQAGAGPIKRRMIQNASGDPKVISGKLRGSIKVGAIKGRRVTIGIHKGDGAAYGVSVEYGHGGPAPAPPHPFIRPAFDAESETAYETMKRELRAAIDRRA